MEIYIIILIILLFFYTLYRSKIENYTVSNSINYISRLYNQGNMTVDNLDIKSDLIVEKNFVAKDDLSIEDDLTVNKNVTVNGDLMVKGVNSRIPTGTIVIWWQGNPPNGWVYCDGNNGTPKLEFLEKASSSGFMMFGNNNNKGLPNKYIMKK